MEHYYEVVVETLRGAGYRWYETANFCRPGRESQHNLGYWLGHDYLGVGVGAVSTIGLERRKLRPSLPRYLEAVEAGAEPPCEVEQLTASQRELERLMLGLRLDRPVELADGRRRARSSRRSTRMEQAGMVARGDGNMWLTDRGRHVADEVVVSHGAMNARPELSPRQLQILTDVVASYIATGHPVGSRTLVEKNEIDASPSTVRYELAELEARGLLEPPAHLGGTGADRRRLPDVRRAPARSSRWAPRRCRST